MENNKYTLEDADFVANLFFDVVLPLIVIAGYFVTSRGNEALIVNNYYYRYQSISKDQKIKKWVCMTDRCSCSISWCGDKVVKINGEKVGSDFNGTIPPHSKNGSVDKCKYSEQECKTKLLHSELKGAATSIKKIIEDKQLQLKKSGMTTSDI
jgi:hypothetical protein